MGEQNSRTARSRRKDTPCTSSPQMMPKSKLQRSRNRWMNWPGGGARRMILAALELEVEHYAHALRHVRDEQGHAMVVRNGKARQRTVHLGAGSLKIRAKSERSSVRPPFHQQYSAILHAALTTVGGSFVRVVSSWSIDRRLLRSARSTHRT